MIDSQYYFRPYNGEFRRPITIYSDKVYTLEELFPETKGVPPRFSDIVGIRQEFELSDRYIIQTAYAPNMGEAGQTSRTVIQGEFKFNGKELVSGTIASKIDVSSTGAISGKVFTTPVKVVFSEIDGVWGDL